MTAPLRVIDTAVMPARWNVAATAALTELHGAGRIGDTLRFHRYPACVLIGRHQVLARAIDLECCRRDGIEIARRVTGGGAVYMAPGVLAFDLVIGRKRVGLHLAQATQRIGEAIAAGLSRLGAPARYRPDNEIEVEGRRISGMSGYCDGGTALHQGAILIDTDLRAMADYLRLPPGGAPHLDRLVSARMTTIAGYLGRVPAAGEVEAAVAGALARALGLDAAERGLPEEERALIATRQHEEFGQDSFVFADPPANLPHAMVGHDGGVDAFIRLHAGAEGRIDQIWLTGAFTASPSRAILDLEAALRGLPMREAPRKATEFLDGRRIEISGASRLCIAGAIAKARKSDFPAGWDRR
jgi:lipoate-protein ligase A